MKNNNKIRFLFMVIGLFIVLYSVLFLNKDNIENNFNNNVQNNQINNVEVKNDNTNQIQDENLKKQVEGNLEIHMIDVGQADSFLYKQGNKVMLIDAGPKDAGPKVVEYLKSLNISKIDILIGTHPHEDHMGGMAEVVKNFDIGDVYIPNTENESITTKYYLNFLNAIENKKLKITYPKVGDTIKLGDANVTFLSPSKTKYEDINNYSIATKVSFGNFAIVSTGDCEKDAEEEILQSGININAQIYKAGHHGSSSSSSEEFVKAINPKYALISVGKDNSYGHPHKKTIKLFNKMNISIKRTDELGTVIITTDGNDINFNK